MHETLKQHGVEPNPDYDGNFFASMQRCGWLIKGKPVHDWIATYAARLAKTTPKNKIKINIDARTQPARFAP